MSIETFNNNCSKVAADEADVCFNPKGMYIIPLGIDASSLFFNLLIKRREQ
jgi:hypothetical protein